MYFVLQAILTVLVRV